MLQGSQALRPVCSCVMFRFARWRVGDVQALMGAEKSALWCVGARRGVYCAWPPPPTAAQ